MTEATETDGPIESLPGWLAGLESPRKKFTLYFAAEYMEWAAAMHRFQSARAEFSQREQAGIGETLDDVDPIVEEMEQARDDIARLAPVDKKSAREFEFEASLTNGEIDDINRRHTHDDTFDEDAANIELLHRSCVDPAMTSAAWERVARVVGMGQFLAFAVQIASWLSTPAVDADFSQPDLPTSRA